MGKPFVSHPRLLMSISLSLSFKNSFYCFKHLLYQTPLLIKKLDELGMFWNMKEEFVSLLYFFTLWTCIIAYQFLIPEKEL